MNCEQFAGQIGDAVDGTLTAEEQAQIEEHCRTCDACGSLLGDLRQIRAAAASLDRPTPSPEVWHAIYTSVQRRERPGFAALWRNQPNPSHAWVRYGMVAAALTLTLAAAAWFDLRSREGSQPDASAADLTRTALSELHLAEQHYDKAIRSLEQLAVNKDANLDPAVAAAIAQSLQSIDRAISDSRAALEAEPDSLVAQASLLEALRAKVALLQETVSLMNARS